MALDPESYTCPDDHTDLTALVEEALEDEGADIAYGRIPRLGRAPARPRPFAVTVSCPGTAGSGSHDLVCTGTRTR
jgi:hypothetical protein